MPRKEYISGHSVKLLHGGDEYFDALVLLINSANETLHLQFYIFDDDATGKIIIEALTNAVQRNVKVFLMVDGFGSYSLHREFRQRMKLIGIRFRYFSPLPFPGITQAGRRLHHKVCVADSTHAIVGGINIADKYRGDQQHKPWLDYALSVQGEVCKEINSICEQIWRRRFVRMPKNNNINKINDATGVLVRVSQNDWFRRKNQISAAYKTMLRNAHEEIIIVASYFIPSARLLKILTRAAIRKRDVKIILSGNSDVLFMKGAMAYLYEKLLRSGVKIFEYKESVLHAKVCVIDRKWTSIGSHNLNHLSEFFSIEMNLDVMDKLFSKAIAEELTTLMKNQCEEITLDNYRKKSTATKRFFNSISFHLLSMMMRILYMINRKEAGSESTK